MGRTVAAATGAAAAAVTHALTQAYAYVCVTVVRLNIVDRSGVSPCPCGSSLTLIVEQFISRTPMSQTEWTEEILYCWLLTDEIRYCWLAVQCLRDVLLTLMLPFQYSLHFKGYSASPCRL